MTNEQNAAQLALAFLERTNIQGSEVEAFIEALLFLQCVLSGQVVLAEAEPV